MYLGMRNLWRSSPDDGQGIWTGVRSRHAKGRLRRHRSKVYRTIITHNTPAMDTAYTAITPDSACSTPTTNIVNDTITHRITGNNITI